MRATKFSLNASAPAFQQERGFYTEADIRMIIKSAVQEAIATMMVEEKTLPTLIQTNETKKSTQIDAFFESKPKIDAFLKIDANAKRQEYKMAS